MPRMTKEQLEKLSDLEINRAIAECVIESKYDIRNSFDNVAAKSLLRAVDHERVDYCSNWADMGPLSLECHISSHYLGNGKWAAYDEYEEISATDEFNNPLRAEAIVYILMQEK